MGQDAIYCSPSYPRRLAATEKGYIGMVPKGKTCKDVIVIFHSAQVPFVLRQTSQITELGPEIVYQLVGECYLHGMMDGEGLEFGHVEQDFVIA